jgi:hypothetical protein
MPVWLDEPGNPVAPPVSTADAAVQGPLVVMCGWTIRTGTVEVVEW